MSTGTREPAIDPHTEFLHESGDLLDRVNAHLLVLAGLPEGSSVPPETLNEIFRAAHSLKGLAGMFGFKNVSGLSHKLESLLDSLRLGKLPLDRDAVDVLFEGVEVLTALLRKQDGGPEDLLGAEALALRVARLREGEHEVDRGAILARFEIEPGVLGVLSEYEQHRLVQNLTAAGRAVFLVRAQFELMSFDTGLLSALEGLKGIGEVVASIPDPEVLSGDSIGFKILLGTSRPLEEVVAFLEASGLRAERIRARSDEGAGSIPAPGGGSSAPETSGVSGAGPTRTTGSSGPSVASTQSGSLGWGHGIRVDLPRLDAMLNLAGELLLSRAEITRMADGLRSGQDMATLSSDLGGAAQVLERRLRALEELILDIRMVPLDRLYERLARVVRRVSRDVGKEIELITRGAETRLDKLLVEALADSLLHLIHNSIDHGIEPPSVRSRAGKRPVGTVSLEARQLGGQVVLTVEDDGAGIDVEQVRQVAMERGVIGAEASLSLDEIVDLLFQPGFSTRSEVDEVSGRGVGLDVVRSNIAAVKGTVRMVSALGKGTRVTVVVPLTLARIGALLVGVGDQSFALPLDAIQRYYQLAGPSAERLRAPGTLDPEEDRIPLLRLDELLGIRSQRAPDEPEWVVVTAVGKNRVGVVVDSLEGQQDVLVKDVGPLLSRIHGIAGVAEVGQGRILLLLEPSTLVNEGMGFVSGSA